MLGLLLLNIYHLWGAILWQHSITRFFDGVLYLIVKSFKRIITTHFFISILFFIWAGLSHKSFEWWAFILRVLRLFLIVFQRAIWDAWFSYLLVIRKGFCFFKFYLMELHTFDWMLGRVISFCHFLYFFKLLFFDWFLFFSPSACYLLFDIFLSIWLIVLNSKGPWVHLRLRRLHINNPAISLAINIINAF